VSFSGLIMLELGSNVGALALRQTGRFGQRGKCPREDALPIRQRPAGPAPAKT
jgi:hypothetical protein